jgi:hypothetical protein
MHLPDGSELSLRDCTVQGLYQEATGLAEGGAAPSKPSTANSVEGSQKQSTIRASDSFVQVSTEVLTHSALAPAKATPVRLACFALFCSTRAFFYFEIFFCLLLSRRSKRLRGACLCSMPLLLCILLLRCPALRCSFQV